MMDQTAQQQIDAALAIDPEKLPHDEIVAARDSVQSAMFMLDEQLGTIKSQIDGAKGKVAASHDYSDADWWRRVNGALRFKGRQRQQMQIKLGRLNQLIRVGHSRRMESRFIDAAKLILPRETFKAIWKTVSGETTTEHPENDFRDPIREAGEFPADVHLLLRLFSTDTLHVMLRDAASVETSTDNDIPVRGYAKRVHKLLMEAIIARTLAIGDEDDPARRVPAS